MNLMSWLVLGIGVGLLAIIGLAVHMFRQEMIQQARFRSPVTISHVATVGDSVVLHYAGGVRLTLVPSDDGDSLARATLLDAGYQILFCLEGEALTNDDARQNLSGKQARTYLRVARDAERTISLTPHEQKLIDFLSSANPNFTR